LPWHRAYLLYFEHYLRDQDPDVGVPWWDWSSNRSLEVGVPAAVSAEVVDGQPNPLYKAHIRATDYVAPNLRERYDRDTVYSPDRPSELRRKLLEVIEKTIADKDADRPISDRLIMALRSIRQFEGDSGFSATLRDIHDFIHGWTGGDMASVGTAAYVPIFWSHHSMIDRLWYLWQIENGVNNIPVDHLPVVLQPFGLTVSAVLDIAELGYEYAVSDVVVGGPG
jgi:tyrosinase